MSNHPYRTITLQRELWNANVDDLTARQHMTAHAASWVRSVIAGLDTAYEICHRKLCDELKRNNELCDENTRLRRALEEIANWDCTTPENAGNPEQLPAFDRALLIRTAKKALR